MEHSSQPNFLDIDMNSDSENMECENVLLEEKSSDELLIDAVRSYPYLYDSSLKEYKDLIMKENSWSEIALIMNTTAKNCQNRWYRLRERLSKEQRFEEIESRSGSGASRRLKFPLFNNMKFLSKHIKLRKSFTNVKSIPVKKISEKNSNNISICNWLDSSSNMSQSTINSNTNFSYNIEESNGSQNENVETSESERSTPVPRAQSLLSPSQNKPCTSTCNETKKIQSSILKDCTQSSPLYELFNYPKEVI